MKETQTPYWFHAKRYGWGWGLPARREGWMVMGVWLTLVAVFGSWLMANRHVLLYGLFMVAMVGTLIAVCYLKGEPPKWRWGK